MIPLPHGFRAHGMPTGIKREGLDLGVLVGDAAYPARAVFTRNSLLGAHVPVCQDHLAQSGGRVRAIVVNSGNANCATGQRGLDAARALCHATAEELTCPPHEVLVISTGVIGAQLPIERMLASIPDLCAGATTDGGERFARAILTTDTDIKHATRPGVAGIAKGSGMIHPDLATMLAFFVAESREPRGADWLEHVVDRSFHRLTVDGDTSPNDTVVYWFSEHDSAEADVDALTEVSQSVCRQIAADGEGASRTITIVVHGARDEAQASEVGRAIGTSMLTKTAVTGRDPNWGRILSAAGRTAAFDPSRARVWVGDATVFENGEPRPEAEAVASAHLQDNTDVELGVDLGTGPASAEVWTCDLTKEYVSINADYRT